MPKQLRLRALGQNLPAGVGVSGLEVGRVIDASGPLSIYDAHPVVWACVHTLASAVARSRWVARTPDGQDAGDSPGLQTVLRGANNLPAQMIWEITAREVIQRGNAFLWRNGAELRPILDGAISSSTDRTVTGTTLEGSNVTLAPRSYIAIHGPGFDGLASPSPIEAAARKALQVDNAARQLQEGNARSGLNGRAVLTMDKDFYAAAAKRGRDDIAKSLEAGYTEERGAGRVPVLPPGVVPAQMGGVSPADLQLIEMMKWNALDICRAFGVPPRMVFVYDQQLRVTGFEAQASDWQRQSVEPWCERIASQVSYALSPPRLDNGAALHLDSSELSVGTYSEQITANAAAVAGGLMTPNEARARMGLPPHPDGDQLIMPAGSPGDQQQEESTDADI